MSIKTMKTIGMCVYGTIRVVHWKVCLIFSQWRSHSLISPENTFSLVPPRGKCSCSTRVQKWLFIVILLFESNQYLDDRLSFWPGCWDYERLRFCKIWMLCDWRQCQCPHPLRQLFFFVAAPARLPYKDKNISGKSFLWYLFESRRFWSGALENTDNVG